ncbi:MAG TPA: YciI family protein [Terracidiphilus sp.]|nr:YciI family protein [Terracidiphilus sp.]
MQYMLLIHADENAYAQMPPEAQQQGYAAYMSYMEALKQAGVYIASGRLRPTSSTSRVHIVNGKAQVLDGPFVETKEQLGGYFLIDAADLDAALAWAARCPGASHGTVEVRPLWIMEPQAN